MPIDYHKIVILTGAGISAESGVKTFRASDGLWEGHRVEDVASPQGFIKNPNLVYEFYNLRRQQLLSQSVRENEAHRALAMLEKNFRGEVITVTQNIDDLHERGGSQNVLHMHGELLKARCTQCDKVYECRDDFDQTTICVKCKKTAGLRPHIVWFGEMPMYMSEITHCLSTCDLFVSIGTSGNVYPAAGFVEIAAHHGAETLEINLEPSRVHTQFDRTLYGSATQVVVDWVDELLA